MLYSVCVPSLVNCALASVSLPSRLISSISNSFPHFEFIFENERVNLRTEIAFLEQHFKQTYNRNQTYLETGTISLSPPGLKTNPFSNQRREFIYIDFVPYASLYIRTRQLQLRLQFKPDLYSQGLQLYKIAL